MTNYIIHTPNPSLKNHQQCTCMLFSHRDVSKRPAYRMLKLESKADFRFIAFKYKSMIISQQKDNNDYKVQKFKTTSRHRNKVYLWLQLPVRWLEIFSNDDVYPLWKPTDLLLSGWIIHLDEDVIKKCFSSFRWLFPNITIGLYHKVLKFNSQISLQIRNLFVNAVLRHMIENNLKWWSQGKAISSFFH